MSEKITCNWCCKNLKSSCKYVHDGNLPLSCCKKCFKQFVENNGEPEFVENYYYAWCI